MAIVQGTMLYVSELTWNGRMGMEREYQAAISRMGRAKIGALRSAPLGIVAAESGSRQHEHSSTTVRPD